MRLRGTRPAAVLARTPLRVRLVAGFCLAMMLVLTAGGAFVYWRVQYDLDRALDQSLTEQASALVAALAAEPPTQAVQQAVTPGASGQVVAADGSVVASSTGLQARLLSAGEVDRARTGAVRHDSGNLLLDGDRRLRVEALPAVDGTVAVVAVRLGLRDEGLRELLAQLAAAGAASLLAAAVVGWVLARSALQPIEGYRAEAERVAAGETGLRLHVPAREDEVTRLGRTLNSLLDAQERAAARERRFVADASHELRTPLALLSGEVELALRRPRSPVEYERVLHEVSSDVGRLTALAEQLLSQAVPAGGTAEVVPAVERAAARARRQLPVGRPVATAVGAALGTAVVGLPEAALDGLLSNLVDNAVRHGAGAVAVCATRRGTWVLLEVHDGGAGADPALVPHLDERFRRGDASRRTAGAGLGLSIAQAHAQRAGGALRFCQDRQHHTYGSPAPAVPPCAEHPSGTTVSVVLPTTRPGPSLLAGD